MTDRLVSQTELYFRTHIHTVLPLHAALVEAMCRAPRVPQELATVLEDIGQGYCRLADDLNAELIRRGELAVASQAEDEGAETRIDAFVERLIASLGHIEFADGQRLSARHAFEAHDVAGDALRTVLLLARKNQIASDTVP